MQGTTPSRRVADQFYAEPAGRQIDVPHFNSANA